MLSLLSFSEVNSQAFIPKRLINVNTSKIGSSARNYTICQNRLFFAGGYGIYYIDSAHNSPVLLLTETKKTIEIIDSLNNKILYTSNNGVLKELWSLSMNGSTEKLYTFLTDENYMANLGRMNTDIVLKISNKYKCLVTSGTASETKYLSSIKAFNPQFPFNFIHCGDSAYFINLNTKNFKFNLFRTNGKDSGTTAFFSTNSQFKNQQIIELKKKGNNLYILSDSAIIRYNFNSKQIRKLCNSINVVRFEPIGNDSLVYISRSIGEKFKLIYIKDTISTTLNSQLSIDSNIKTSELQFNDSLIGLVVKKTSVPSQVGNLTTVNLYNGYTKTIEEIYWLDNRSTPVFFDGKYYYHSLPFSGGKTMLKSYEPSSSTIRNVDNISNSYEMPKIFHSKAFFTTQNDSVGEEIYTISKGQQGIELFADLIRRDMSSDPVSYIRAGEYVFFSAHNPIRRLYRTNLKTLITDSVSIPINVVGLTFNRFSFNDSFLNIVVNNDLNKECLISINTRTKAFKLLTPYYPSNSISFAGKTGNKSLILISMYGLFASDGNACINILSINDKVKASSFPLYYGDNLITFVRYGAGLTKMIISNGTLSGSKMVHDSFAVFNSNANLIKVNQNIIYYFDYQNTRWNIWKFTMSDLKPKQVTNHPNLHNCYDTGYFVNGKMVVFLETISDGYNIYNFDGTDSGLHMIKKISETVSSIYPKAIVHENKIYFHTKPPSQTGATAEIWQSDLTESGTRKIFAETINSDFNLVGFSNSYLVYASENELRYTDNRNTWQVIPTSTNAFRIFDTEIFDSLIFMSIELDSTGMEPYYLKTNKAAHYFKVNSLQISPEISVFPNPFSSMLSIYSKESEIQFCAIYDMIGKTIFESAFERRKNKIELKLPELKSGIYTLQIMLSNGNTLYEQVIKL